MSIEEYNINNLCEQFQHLFQQIRDTREQQNKVESDNINLQILVDEELEQYKQQIDEYQDIMTHQVGQEGNTQGEVRTLNQFIKQQLQQLSQKIYERQSVHTHLLNQKAQLSYSNSEEENIKLQLNDHMGSIRLEIEQMNSNCEQHREIISNIKQTNQEATQRIEEYQLKIQLLEQQLMDQEKFIQENIDSNYNQNEDLKQMQSELRGMMKTQSQIDVATKEYEKVINKLCQELDKKTSRQQIILQNQQQIQNKSLKKRESEQIYQQIRESNTLVATENVQIREQLTNFIKSLPQEIKQKLNKSNDKSTISLRNSQTFNQGQMKSYDDTICQNHVKLREIQEVKNQQAKFYNDTQQEVEFLEQRLSTMKENIEILNLQYSQITLKE